MMTNYVPMTKITDHDFLIFAITLRKELAVTTKTMKRYLQQAWRALHAAGFKTTNPKNTSATAVIHSIGLPAGKTQRCKLDYCSIKWNYIKL